ncbi:MAG TPA: hypothetical protein P5294_00575 [Smithellaceae bacterium]|nr:hypothetical protein [Smithellaceae bacterium]HRS88356.1 hypothetical protein [Smithellaceae bacterium]HRV25001.1 hypothetical protein [Smithellaceae bacterium]
MKLNTRTTIAILPTLTLTTVIANAMQRRILTHRRQAGVIHGRIANKFYSSRIIMRKKIFIIFLVVIAGIAMPAFSQTNNKKELLPPYAIQGRWEATAGHSYMYGAIDFYIVDGKVQAGIYTTIAACMPSWMKTLDDLRLSYTRIPVNYDGQYITFKYNLGLGNVFRTDPNCKSDTLDLSEHTLSFSLILVSENRLSGTLIWDNRPPVIVEYAYNKNRNPVRN